MSEDIYILIIEDRHCDTDAIPFRDAGDAIVEAKRICREYAHDESDIEEEIVPGWLYCASYSCENDCVRVIQARLR